MMRKMFSKWLQGASPPAIALGLALLTAICIIGFPLGASASQASGQQTIGQTVDDGMPPDIVAMRIDQQVYFYDDTGTIDTSQYTASTHIRAGTAVSSTKTAFYRDDGIGASPPDGSQHFRCSVALARMQSQMLDHTPRSVPMQA